MISAALTFEWWQASVKIQEKNCPNKMSVLARIVCVWWYSKKLTFCYFSASLVVVILKVKQNKKLNYNNLRLDLFQSSRIAILVLVWFATKKENFQANKNKKIPWKVIERGTTVECEWVFCNLQTFVADIANNCFIFEIWTKRNLCVFGF